jgi:hypothetical protein
MPKTQKQRNKAWYDKNGKEYHSEYRAQNREKRRKWNKEWIANNKDRYNASKYKYRERLKIEAIARYSAGEMKCAVCGFSDLDALCLDHIANDGAQHRKQLKISSRNNTSGGCSTYQALKREGWPAGLQVLCANCNQIKQQELLRSERMKNKFYARDYNPTQLQAEGLSSALAESD